MKKTIIFLLILCVLLVTQTMSGEASSLSLPAGKMSARARESVTPYSSVAWYDPDWTYRTPVTISNSGSVLSDYQVQINLTSSFDFANVQFDGSDLHVTASDGMTPIPAWIESWNPPTSASLWVRIPSIPVGGTTVYLYYGNLNSPAQPQIETPPIGTWTRAAANPVTPIGGVGEPLAENIVYDDATGHFWMALTNRSNISVNLIWSDNPGDPASWTWYEGNPLISSANAPHLMKIEDTWYIFYETGTLNIAYATSSSVSGPYTLRGSLLTHTSGWEANRVGEPYVIQRQDGTWVLIYIGQGAVGTSAQIGYATSTNPGGPYTRYASNPVIGVGLSGSYDQGMVNSPWVYEYQGIYYIGYAARRATSGEGYRVAFATTSDWVNFTKGGVMLNTAVSGWDSTNVFRGAVTRIGDTYYLTYTGGSAGNYRIGIATQPVYMAANTTNLVFPFYDPFNGTALDLDQWVKAGTYMSSQVVVSGGTLTLTDPNAATVPAKVATLKMWPMAYLVEARGRHPQAGFQNLAIHVGSSFAYDLNNVVRILDDYPTNFSHWLRQSVINGSASPYTLMAQALDTNWHIFRIFRLSPNVAGFQVDTNPVETHTSNVPTAELPAFLMSYSNLASANQFIVDWIRVRKIASPEPTATVDAEQSCAPSPIYVDDDYTPADAGPHTWGCDAFGSIQTGLNTVLPSGTVYVRPGTYTESVTVENDLALIITGTATLNGDLTLQSGVFQAPPYILTLTGDFTYIGGAFYHNDGTLHFGGSGYQDVNVDTFTFYNLSVADGATLRTTGTILLDGTLANDGVVQETKAVIDTSPVTFSLGNITIIPTTQGALSSLQIRRYDENHPNSTAGIQEGIYWEILPTGDDFTATLILPHYFLTDPQVCKYPGGMGGMGWDCARSSFDATTVTRSGISEFSDWAVGDAVTPTVLRLRELAAVSQPRQWMFVLASFLVVGILAVGIGLGYRRRGGH